MSASNMTVIFETVHGSRAYGLATESSDTDLRGVFVPAPVSFRGYLEGPEQLEPSAERVLYEIRKFFPLAAACNPTVIEVLFTDPADHVTVSPEGAQLLERKREFLSRLAGDSFGRYGLAQLHRIRTHRRWLLSPPQARPERASYGLPSARRSRETNKGPSKQRSVTAEWSRPTCLRTFSISSTASGGTVALCASGSNIRSGRGTGTQSGQSSSVSTDMTRSTPCI